MDVCGSRLQVAPLALKKDNSGGIMTLNWFTALSDHCRTRYFILSTSLVEQKFTWMQYFQFSYICYSHFLLMQQYKQRGANTVSDSWYHLKAKLHADILQHICRTVTFGHFAACVSNTPDNSPFSSPTTITGLVELWVEGEGSAHVTVSEHYCYSKCTSLQSAANQTQTAADFVA